MSTSVHLFSDAELTALLRESQANNMINNISGMLLYSEGSFVQAIEGTAEDVDKTYEKIKKDPRHKNIIKLTEGEIDERIFAYWSMGFKKVSKTDLSIFDAYIDPTEPYLLENKDFHPAITILKTFADTNQF